MGDRDVEVVAAEDGDPNIERRLVDLHRLTDGVYIEKVETVVEKSVWVFLVLCAKVVPETWNEIWRHRRLAEHGNRI